ncbi:MAG: hypothetical protein EZS28_021563 [Streblomastix strix]|uniref:Uncharacterized protein n=1 Tax=Streblomastix strix TaxID=222440 RepID=A0A5J4VKA8_9EUKA|nr:MAG: hypothetical protein EZS28_021563 [Streblomastix strix]
MGQLIIEPSDTILDQGIRIMKNKANWDSFVLTGCNTNPLDRDDVWKVGSTSSQFRIQKQEDQAYDYKAMIIDFDCTTLKFNNQIVSPLHISSQGSEKPVLMRVKIYVQIKATVQVQRLFIDNESSLLARQTHFRGYYLLNADITNLPTNAPGDFAFSAESCTVWMYELAWYDSGQLVPDQVTPASDELPIINGTAAAGNSTSYSRGDHIHPQQLTYDNDITATKFIKSGGTATEIQLANGDTTTIDSKISRTYSSGAGGYIRLCVFPIGTSTGTPYILFQVTCNSNSMQTIDLLPQYTVNGIIDLFGNITAPSHIQPTYNIYYGVDQLLHTHTGSYSSAIYTAWIHMMTGSGSVTVTVTINTSQTCQWEISKTNDNALTINPSSLRQADRSVGLSINSDSSLIKFNGNELVNVGTDQTITGRKIFADNTLDNIQINSSAISYGEGLRIANISIRNLYAIYIGTSPTNTSGEIAGQWTIIKRPNCSLTISRTADQNITNKGLMISADGNTLSFNGSVIGGTGATSGASNGSVSYSAGNPILWGLNSVDTNGGFYSDGPKVYWRAKPVTLGAVPP